MRLRSVITACAAAGTLVLAAPAAAAEPGTVQSTDDPLRSKQWGIEQIHAPEAWSESTGAGQVIAVVDTGVDLNHPDLKSQLVPGATFVGCGQNPAPCGNGGWKGVDGKGQPSDTHGTHVSGIAAAATDNGIGIAGVAPDARIMPIKVLEGGSGSFTDIAAGIRYAADHGADVINLSVGALPGAQLLTLTGLQSAAKDAIAYAREKGVVVVAAAGNELSPLCATPSWESGALCVTATDRNEFHSLYSNLGIKLDANSLAAPGGSAIQSCAEDVWSTVPRGTGSTECGSDNYDSFAGTSMAAPHVAGVAALLSAQGRTAAGVEQALLETARTPLLEQTGLFTPLFGHGIVDAEAAVNQPL
ncbi:subtilase family protein [Halopolyspora algeriensis]|uniref:Subtilase family protein n=1 Tax=Halopolyspora algeriensis TaxID=1500506 RepID=A0A368VXK7_9ACTN|nr:S8 family peptidase [Halopolyspora algeriensis]RCW46717.1 subtilase family protein [Halopolyspora algeriensis]TQM46742.1 subtilase family protein [Halopolyspora algeriensis]